ncbi:RNA polymerase III subunit C11 [Golovinomyces cichoracearum]|uniref:RNA polymerase III subunit C11 n=1 Tax=Golovinomyces cichoracearum TaxID=62708 RepID=A0A420IZF3_9PEZI|nr:RNA polymerase III subunit C11 [Golovinomyces cichoracearum]
MTQFAHPVPTLLPSLPQSHPANNYLSIDLNAKPYFERKNFVRKEREDVFGGPGAWDNADKAKMQCPKDGCDGDEAAFFQVQIRSADEPMTGFYKVCAGFFCLGRRRELSRLIDLVYDVRKSLERELEFYLNIKERPLTQNFRFEIMWFL